MILYSFLGGGAVYKIGEIVRWMEPLDHDYSYGKLLRIEKNRAIVEERGYYYGKISSIHLRYIRHMERGWKGESKKSDK